MNKNVSTGVISVTFRQFAYRHIIDEVKNSPLKNIEWASNIHAPYSDFTRLSGIREEMDRFGMKSNSYASFYKLGSNDLAEFTSILDSAKILGAKNIRIWGAFLLGSPYGSLLDFFDRTKEEFETLAELTAREGMILSVEPNKNSYINSADDVKYIAERLNPVFLNMAAFYWQPDLSRSRRQNSEDLKKVLPYLSNVHINNTGEHDKFSLGECALNWDFYFKILSPVFCGGRRRHSLILEFTKTETAEEFHKDALLLDELAGKYFS